mgnify:CR=1 FL=1
MKNDNIFKPTSNIVDNCHVDKATYDKMYKESTTYPDIFWDNHGKRIDWIKSRYDPDQVVYMGDGIFDHYVMKDVAYAIAPSNADNIKQLPGADLLGMAGAATGRDFDF